MGRIQIVITFAIPKLMFRASAIPISKELLKTADSIFYSFIWNGKDNVKRNVLTATIENGGLNMLDIDSMVRTKRVFCLKKYLEDYPSPWKFFLTATRNFYLLVESLYSTVFLILLSYP